MTSTDQTPPSKKSPMPRNPEKRASSPTKDQCSNPPPAQQSTAPNRGKMPLELLRGRMVSEVWQDYIEPLVISWNDVRPRPSVEDLNQMCQVPWTIWNAVNYHDYYPKAGMSHLLEAARQLIRQSAEPQAAAMVDWYIARKREKFGEFRYLLGDCAFYEAADGEIRCRATASMPNTVVEHYGVDGGN